ncbi:MAG TPA: FAD/NAD(P)-binding oxidoreductase, partial [Sphingobacteriaceae bacterium]
LAVPDNPLGWVDLNKFTLQHNRYKNIFGCGDAGSTPNSKTGAAIRKQAPVLVGNLLRTIEGRSLDKEYNGYGSCPLITGYGKLVLAEFDYQNNPTETFPFNQAKERYSMWLLKSKVLPWMYWNMILKGTV